MNLKKDLPNYKNALKTLKRKKIVLEIDLNLGDYAKTFWGTDVSS